MRINQRGDSLIEVLLATTVLALVLTSTYAITSRALRASQLSREREQASLLAQSQTEVLRGYRDSQSWNEFKTSLTSANVPVQAGPSAPAGRSFWFDCYTAAAPECVPERISGSAGSNLSGEGEEGQGFYRAYITGRFANTIDVTNGEYEFFEGIVYVKWEPPGGGVEQRSSHYIKLANTEGFGS